MAIDKKSFVLYSDQINLFENLEDEEAGKLIKHIFRYVNDLNPTETDKLIKIAFEPIKQQFKRDLVSWIDTKSKRSYSGKLGNLQRWNIDLYNKVTNNEIDIDSALEIHKSQKVAKGRKVSQSIANVAVNDNVNVNVNVNDNVNVSYKPTTNEIFFNDLQGSTHFENIIRNLNIPKEKLITKIPEFRKAAKVEYPNFVEFCNHFKNWVKKQAPEQGLKLKTSFK